MHRASPSSTSRRTFLQVGAAGLATVGLVACGMKPAQRGTTDRGGSRGTGGERGGDHGSGQLSARPGPATSPVRYREFEGGHAVPPHVAGEALDWFLGPGD